MTRDEVIRLAKEAEFEVAQSDDGTEDVVDNNLCGSLTEQLERFAALVAAHEREACSQLCDQMEKDAEGTDCCKWPTPADCAYVIRAKNKT